MKRVELESEPLFPVSEGLDACPQLMIFLDDFFEPALVPVGVNFI